MIIIEAWTLVHGKRPGITNRVQGMVEDYWVACGGSRSAAGDVQRWKEPIARALRVKPAKLGITLFPRPAPAPAKHQTADQVFDRMFQTTEAGHAMRRAVPDSVMAGILQDNGIGRK
jgi:hypothetical protein